MSDQPPLERLDVARLLTIDVDSELRKLTQAQLQGPWQLPAELVRRALRRGATAVEVELGRGQLRVRSRGGAVPAEVLRQLSALLDEKRSPERRHRALSALERAGALSLLGLVGLRPASIRIVSPEANEAGETLGLSWKRDGSVEFQRFTGEGPDHVDILVRGAKYDRNRAREWLRDVTRYANADINVDGKAVSAAALPARGFGSPLSLIRIHTPVPATISIPREGELARLYLLQDGLVTTHMSVTNSPAFEAAIEMTELCEATASAARLREAIADHVKPLVNAAINHLIDLGQRSPSLAPEQRRRLTQLLLYTARRYRDHAKVIARLPLFRGLERDGRERWCDLLALRQSAREEGGERLLTTLFPDQDPTGFAPDGRVYILDESERALLGELLEIGFRPPRRRMESGRSGLLATLRASVQLGRGRDLLIALRPGGRAIPDADLDAHERSLLTSIRALLDGCEVAMCTGNGPVRRLGAGPDKLLLPRESDEVRAAVISVSRDPAWIYPAMLALLDGREFPERARRRWSITRLS